MIRPIDPDEPVTINGAPVTGRQLAEARQQLAHEGSYLPTWSELDDHDREVAALSAGGWLRALARLAPAATPPATEPAERPYRCPGCGRTYRTPEHAAGCADDHAPRQPY